MPVIPVRVRCGVHVILNVIASFLFAGFLLQIANSSAVCTNNASSFLEHDSVNRPMPSIADVMAMAKQALGLPTRLIKSNKRRTAASPRNLVTRNRSFVDRATGKVVQLRGTNVVMKGPVISVT